MGVIETGVVVPRAEGGIATERPPSRAGSVAPPGWTGTVVPSATGATRAAVATGTSAATGPAGRDGRPAAPRGGGQGQGGEGAARHRVLAGATFACGVPSGGRAGGGLASAGSANRTRKAFTPRFPACATNTRPFPTAIS